MKLFGGKKGDDKGGHEEEEAGYYDSPVETVSLSDSRPAAQARGNGAATASGSIGGGAADDEARPHFGIDQAIQLMRSLPVDQNVELVVTVIKTTLESLRVKVADIIVDADRKTKDLEERVANLKRAIADFEKEIETRREEIGRLEADFKETTSVRARLELAQKSQRGVVAKTG